MVKNFKLYVFQMMISNIEENLRVVKDDSEISFIHTVFHRADATNVIEAGNILNKQIDLTGGWHDAGDYVKFLNTTAYTTYTLLFAFDFDSRKFSFDKNKNNIPDIL